MERHGYQSVVVINMRVCVCVFERQMYFPDGTGLDLCDTQHVIRVHSPPSHGTRTLLDDQHGNPV